jgi:hypothetical protein
MQIFCDGGGEVDPLLAHAKIEKAELIRLI